MSMEFLHEIRRVTTVVVSTALLVIATAAGAEQFNPFHVPKEKFQEQVHTIALQPVVIPAGIENGPAVQGDFEQLVEAAARSAGFIVVEPAVFDGIWRANSAKLGGIYNSSTGEGDEKKFDMCFEYTARELARTHDVDAIVKVAITWGRHHAVFVEPFLMPYTQAYTYGEPIVLHGRELTSQWIEQVQYLKGTFFNLYVLDQNGRTMFGIGLPIEWRRIYWRRGYDDRGGPELADAAKNRQVVSRVFSWLTRGTDPPSAQ